MSSRRVFTDKNENEVTAYINADELLYIEIGHRDDQYPNCVVLDKNDAIEFLSEIEREIKSM